MNLKILGEFLAILNLMNFLGVNVNAIDKFGETPLFKAVIAENVTAVEWLLNHNVETRIANR